MMEIRCHQGIKVYMECRWAWNGNIWGPIKPYQHGYV
jgi:hypothetical protein